jgi:hypothetical protein
MFSMRTLLSSDPFLPKEAREAVGRGHHSAREQLVRLGANDCEAAELLDDHRDGCAQLRRDGVTASRI